MFIDRAFLFDQRLDGLSAAARGVYAGIAAMLYSSSRGTFHPSSLPAWAANSEGLDELRACGVVFDTDEGLCGLEGLERPSMQTQAPERASVGRPRKAPPLSLSLDGETDEERKRRMVRERVAKCRAKGNGNGNAYDLGERYSGNAESVTDDEPCNANSVTDSVTPERYRERKEEETRRDRERKSSVTNSVTESVTCNANGRQTKEERELALQALHGPLPAAPSVPAETPGEKTSLREAHSHSPPEWAKQQATADSITTGRSVDVAAVWASFVLYQVAEGKTSASWLASWKRWLGNERVHAGSQRGRYQPFEQPNGQLPKIPPRIRHPEAPAPIPPSIDIQEAS